MQFRPSNWEQNMLSGYTMTVLGNLYTADDLNTTRYFGLPIEDGSVTVDLAQQSRRTCSLTLVDDDGRFADVSAGRLTPNEPGDLLTPYGTVVLLQYGVSYPGFTNFFGNNIYFVNLGYFWIDEVNPLGDGRIEVVGYDFARHVSQVEFATPYVIPAGTVTTTAILDALNTRVPEGLVNRAATTVPSVETLPATVLDINQDPWDQFVRMAEAIGYELYYGVDGGPVLTPKVDATARPVAFEYVDGVNALIARQRRMSASPGYNGIVGKSEATTIATPLRSEIWDDNPSSPTYYKGRYGPIPKFVSYPFAATQAQLDAAVRADLSRILGGTETIELAVLPDPTLDVEDVFRFKSPRLGIDALYQVQRYTIPLREDAAAAISATRVRTTTLTGA